MYSISLISLRYLIDDGTTLMKKLIGEMKKDS